MSHFLLTVHQTRAHQIIADIWHYTADRYWSRVVVLTHSCIRYCKCKHSWAYCYDMLQAEAHSRKLVSISMHCISWTEIADYHCTCHYIMCDVSVITYCRSSLYTTGWVNCCLTVHHIVHSISSLLMFIECTIQLCDNHTWLLHKHTRHEHFGVKSSVKCG
jgi:hypothetical protein